MSLVRLLIKVCFLAASISAYAQSMVQGYCPDSKGQVLEYVRKNNSDGSFKWRHTIKVTDVKESGSYLDFTSKSVFSKSNGKPLYRREVVETYRVDKKTGNLQMEVGSAMASYIKAVTGLNASAENVYSGLPADLKPGDILPDVSAQVNLGPLTYKLHVFDRKVLRRETISVPAGTFECLVISENKTETGPGHNRSVTNITWYSKGVGYVRHDTYIKEKLDTSEKLVNINR